MSSGTHRRSKLDPIWGLTPRIPILGKVGQENCDFISETLSNNNNNNNLLNWAWCCIPLALVLRKLRLDRGL